MILEYHILLHHVLLPPPIKSIWFFFLKCDDAGYVIHWALPLNHITEFCLSLYSIFQFQFIHSKDFKLNFQHLKFNYFYVSLGISFLINVHFDKKLKLLSVTLD